MTRTAASLGLVAVLLMAGVGRASAEEKKLHKADVPKPVLEAVAKKYPSANMVTFESEQEEGKTLYEIGIRQGSTKMDVEVSPSGKIAVEETVIKTSDVPAAVMTGLSSSKYKGWKIGSVEKVINDEKDDEPEYEFVVSSKKQKFEIVLDKAGKVTKQEDKSKEKDHD